MDTDVALFSMMVREYEQMSHDELADEVMFERMKHVSRRAQRTANLDAVPDNRSEHTPLFLLFPSDLLESVCCRPE